MADVVAICEKCGAFVQAAHVYANGTVGFDPVPTEKHWVASSGCRGSYGLVNVESLRMGQDSARTGGAEDRIVPSWRDRLVAWFHRRRLGVR